LDYFYLEELSRIFHEGVCNLNQAADRLQLPMHVVQRTFQDGLLKGYWKITGNRVFIGKGSEVLSCRRIVTVKAGPRFPNEQ
jgi:hypothetical protein